ncbi:MAG: hypothetical protein HFI90_03600 [Clostridia bacterium]|nr:hypothetical protein [Clostridia bacterium]
MNREEVLEKSRIECNDEGFYDAENQGRKLGLWAFCIMKVAIMHLIGVRGNLTIFRLQCFGHFLP